MFLVNRCTNGRVIHFTPILSKLSTSPIIKSILILQGHLWLTIKYLRPTLGHIHYPNKHDTLKNVTHPPMSTTLGRFGHETCLSLSLIAGTLVGAPTHPTINILKRSVCPPKNTTIDRCLDTTLALSFTCKRVIRCAMNVKIVKNKVSLKQDKKGSHVIVVIMVNVC